MSIKTNYSNNGNTKTVEDDLKGRMHYVENKCFTCGEWVDEDDTVWALPNGKLNTDTGNPYCTSCVPCEDE
jgi:hypothetical protein